MGMDTQSHLIVKSAETAHLVFVCRSVLATNEHGLELVGVFFRVQLSTCGHHVTNTLFCLLLSRGLAQECANNFLSHIYLNCIWWLKRWCLFKDKYHIWTSIILRKLYNWHALVYHKFNQPPWVRELSCLLSELHNTCIRGSQTVACFRIPWRAWNFKNWYIIIAWGLAELGGGHM